MPLKYGRSICLSRAMLDPRPGSAFQVHHVHTTAAGIFGRNDEYCELAAKAFKRFNTWVDMKPMRIPYVAIALNAKSD